jgi:hypothetical protein
MLASRTTHGTAGAILGVIALLICLGFVALDRLEGPTIRAQLNHASPSNQPASLTMDQLIKMTRPATAQPTTP